MGKLEDKLMIKLHLGCGERNFGDEWTHIDGGNFDHLDSHSITDLDFEDNSVDLIYASHVLEYFDRDEVIVVLKEWHRVLKMGGTLRIAVPNFEELSRLYLAQHIPLEGILGPIFGKWQMGDETIYHKTTYDRRSLGMLLRACGFDKEKRYRWQDTEHSEFDDHSQAYMCPNGDKENGSLISLNMECKKIEWSKRDVKLENLVTGKRRVKYDEL